MNRQNICTRKRRCSIHENKKSGIGFKTLLYRLL